MYGGFWGAGTGCENVTDGGGGLGGATSFFFSSFCTNFYSLKYFTD